ncbi:hypothetical protein RI129_011441 [Pyrocoelia pectoralis]|uniref:Cytochrome P450 n=1 Tax=Pyrocoelia pectoralis TaxID=417401 RepID=A0AAN7V151_9COLE
MLSISIFLVSIILVFLAYLDTKKPNNFPPGPKWFPIIGSAWQLHKLQQKKSLIVKVSEELALKYGPLVGVRIGCTRIVFVYGLRATQEFLTRDDFIGRPDSIFFTSRTWGKRRGIIFVDSEFWREQKQFFLKQMSFRKENIAYSIEKEVKGITNNLKKSIEDGNGEAVFQMGDLFGISILNVLWTLMVGDEYAKDEKEMKAIAIIVKDLFGNSLVVGGLFGHFPFLRYICPNYCGYNEYVNINGMLTNFIKKTVEKMKTNYNSNTTRGFIDSYLHVLNSEEKAESFSEDQLVAIGLDLLFAGYETTSKTVSLAFLFMLLHPDIQKKAQDEIDQIVGRDRLPTLEDRRLLHYIEAISLETTRLFTGHILNSPRRAVKDCYFNGYFIPKGTTLAVNFRGVSLNTESGWEDPKIFNPERFIKNGKLTIPNNYMAFGLGKRRCLGESLAKAHMFLIFASLLQTFNFEAIPNDPPIAEIREAFIPCVRPFRGKITLR